jgi:nucleotide-binding universal stress UspA family protein
MSLRCILIPTSAGLDATRRLDASLLLSRRIGAHVRVVFIGPEPKALLATLPEVARAAGVSVESLTREGRMAAAAGRAAFDGWCGLKGVEQSDGGDRIDAVFATWNERVGELEEILSVAGRVTDITLVDRPDGHGQIAERMVDTAVFSTGRPVLVLPERAPDDLLRHVVIAWNGSLEAARVVGLSIDLLHDAERVTIAHVDDVAEAGDVEDLASYLRWHGIVAHRSPPIHGEGRPLGVRILDAVAKADATMMVMGAYTHSRVRQFQLGGLTRHVLDHATIPVLMTH